MTKPVATEYTSRWSRQDVAKFQDVLVGILSDYYETHPSPAAFLFCGHLLLRLYAIDNLVN